MLHKFRYLLNRNRNGCDKEVDREELEERVSKGAILLDVRSPQEFQEGHLENAILLPEYEIKKRANQILPNKQQEIIAYCSSGHRSQRAQQILERLGYEKVYYLYGGLENND